MNKIWIASIGVIIVIGLIMFASWLAGSGNQAPATNSPGTQTTGLPVAGSVTQLNPSSGGTGTSIASAAGDAIQTKDFMADPATVQDRINAGYYYLGYHTSVGVSDPSATENPPYVITYIAATQYFNIALLQEPIGPVREEMQQYLMDHLGIPQSQMCELKYMVSVPNRVNSQFSGRNLGFSFCPGATPLPK